MRRRVCISCPSPATSCAGTAWGDAPPDEMVRRCEPRRTGCHAPYLYSEAGKVFNFTLSEEELRYLGDICEYYAIVQLDTRLSSLDFYKSLLLS